MQVDRYRRRLESHVAHNQFQAALATLDAWRARAPGLLEPELLHARIDLMRGHYRAARDRAVAAASACECPPELALDVANCLRVLTAHDALVEWAQTYQWRARVAPPEAARIAAVLTHVGAYDLARSWAEDAAQRAPDDVTCLLNRALACIHAGAFDHARTDLEHAIATPQDPAVAHWHLARMGRQTAGDNHVGRLRARIATCADDSPDREYLLFALFKELDDLGETRAAWTALEEGCRRARVRAPWKADEPERLFAALKRQFPLHGPRASIDPHGPTPIFIVGMHRSGTTLLESMLGAHPGVHAQGESLRFSAALRHAADIAGDGVLDDALVAAMARLDYDQVRDRYVAEGRSLAGAASHLTDKLPGNFQLIGCILQALPDARIVHMRRDPMDLCFANLRELFAEGVGYTYAFDDLARYHACYRDLMRHWHEIHPGQVLDVDYETLVRDPLVTTRRVFGFCGLEWHPRVIDPAAWSARATSTLSAVQVRQPVNTASIGRWRVYAEQLAPLREALERHDTVHRNIPVVGSGASG